MKRFVLLLACFLVLVLAGSSWAEVFHVQPGDSIQTAIDLASAGDEIWVEAGTYALGTYIYVSKAVAIYGGFNGTEAQLEERDWRANETIVDGQNNTLCFYVTADARIDGFTITNGYSMYNGGGVRNYQSSPTIANCTFYENESGFNGGGIQNYLYASPTIANCTFSGNVAGYYDGGAIYNYYYSSPTIINSTFHGNTASRYGGAIYNYYFSSPTLTNCTFLENSASISGGGIYNNAYSSPIITNTILWGDTAPNGGEIASVTASYPDVAYSDIQGGNSGPGNIDADPGFVDPPNGDLQLAAGSPCIDVGDPDAPFLPEADFEGDPRIVGDFPDMGVDEFVAPPEEDGLGAFVLYGGEKVRLRRIADSQGNVGSNQKITIARGLSGTLEGDLRALERIDVYGSITIAGDVLTNGEVRVTGRRAKLEFNDGEIIEGEEVDLSLIELPDLDFTAGGPNIRVRRNRSLSLDQGSYGRVRVGKRATLHLSTGEYYMERLYLCRGATLSIDLSGGAVTINVVKRLHMGRRAEIEIESGQTSDVTINVLNDNIIWIGPHAKVRGTLAAPNSRVRFAYRSELEGAVYAKRIYASSRVHFQPHGE